MRTVETLLSDRPRTIRSTEPLAAARARMLREHLQGLAVIDAHDRLVGVVTAFDLLIDAPGESALGDVVGGEVLTVSPHTSAVDAARTMRDHGFHHLVVTGHGHAVVGVLSAFDLLAAIAPEATGTGHEAVPGSHHAVPGDIVVVRGKAIDHRERRGLVIEVRGPDGSPPFVVRWFDDPHAEPHDVLYFPGPDADVERSADDAAADADADAAADADADADAVDAP